MKLADEVKELCNRSKKNENAFESEYEWDDHEKWRAGQKVSNNV